MSTFIIIFSLLAIGFLIGYVYTSYSLTDKYNQKFRDFVDLLHRNKKITDEEKFFFDEMLKKKENVKLIKKKDKEKTKEKAKEKQSKK